MTGFKKKVFKDEESWLKARKEIITATGMASVLGLDPWNSAAKMYKDKLNPTFKSNAFTTIGQWMEPIVVKAANVLLDRDFKLFTENEDKIIFINSKLKLGATPDAISADGKVLLECKTVNSESKLLLWTEHPPINYIAQVYLQLIATDKQDAVLGILYPDMCQKSPVLNLTFLAFTVHRTEELDKLFLTSASAFWDQVKADTILPVPKEITTLNTQALLSVTERIR